MANQIKYQVGFDVNKSNLDSLKKSLQQIQQLSTKDLMKLNNSSMEEAKQALLNIKNQAINVEKALRQAFNTKLNTVNISEFNKSLTQSKTTIQNVYAAFSKAGPAGQNAFRSLSAQVLSTNIQLRQSNGLLSKMATTFANTIKWNIASSAINAMSRSIQQAWGFTKDLDTSLNDIRIVTGKSADEMADFAVQANKAAQNLGQTTTDYTKASLIYYQQGLQDAEVQARTDVTLKAANVTGQSAQQVSEQLTAVWNGYKVSAEQTEVYIDRLAAVAATSASNLEELSTGMSKVASAAAAMGVSEEQLAAQLSTIISVTRQAPQSVGTALRTVFARVADIKAGVDEEGVSLGNYSSKMAALGISVLDMNGNLRDMGEVMEQIGGKWADMSREQQVYLARTMAGQRQYNNLLALFDNFEMYNKQLEVAQNATGTLQKQQDTYMESTEAHLKQLRASMEGIYEKLFNTEGINKLIDGVSLATNFMAQFVSSIGGGGNLLKSLGSIGMMVFSEQIAKGLNTAITNLEIGKQNVAQFNAALEATRQWQGIPGLDQLSTKLLENREQLLSFAGLLNPQQFTGLQSMLNEMTQAANKFSTLSAEQGFLNGAIEQVKEANAAWKDLNDIMKNDAAQQKVIDKIKQQEIAFHNVIDKIKEYHKNLSQIKIQAFNGEDVTKNLTTMKTRLSEYANELSELTNKAGLTKHTQQIEKLKVQLAGLSKDLPAEEMAGKLRDIAAIIGGISKSAQEAGIDLRSKLTAEFQGTVESIGYQTEEAKTKVKSLGDAWEQEVARMQRASSIEIFTRVTGSITSLAMAVKNLQNLGSIWANDDLTIGEKLLQTITNVGMAAGMIVPAYQKLNAVYQAHRLAAQQLNAEKGKEVIADTAGATAAGINAGAKEAQAQATKDLAAAENDFVDELPLEIISNTTAASSSIVDAGAKKVQEEATKNADRAAQNLNKTLLSNPFTAIAMAIMVVVVALGALIKAQEEARKAAIELDKADIEKENKAQEQIESNRQLCNSLEELDSKYKEGEISRYELKSAVQDLIDQYGLEGDAANNLANSYDNLSKYLKNTRKEMALTAQASAKREVGSAEDALVKEYAGNTLSVGGRWGKAQEDQNKKITNIMQEHGFIQDQNSMYMSAYKFGDLDWKDPESIVKAWEAADQAITEMQQTLSASERNSDPIYQDLKKWRDELEEEVELYIQAKQDLQKYSTEVAAITGSADLDNIQTINQYYIQRKKLITDIQAELDKNGDTEADAAAMADTYLAENYRNIYAQFDDAAKFLDKFKEANQDVNDEIINRITKKFANLDSEHMFAVMDASQYATSWSQLETIIDRLANKDLSNVGNVFGRDIENMKANAAEIYKLYQDIYDKVDKGETISAEDYQGLPEQLQNMFTMAADGTYKMIESFKEFEAVVNNLKFDGFRKNLADAYNTQDIVNNTSNFQNMGKGLLTPDELISQQTGAIYTAQEDTGLRGRDEVAQIVSYEKEINAQRLFYLQLVNQGNDAELESIRNLQDKNNANQLTLQQQKEILDKIQAAKDEIDNIDLDQLNSEIEEMQHQLYDAMFPTDADVDTEVLSSLTDVLQSIADSDNDVEDANMRLADSLEEDTRAAEDVAEAILRFDDAIQDVVDNYDDWMDALENGSMQDQAQVLGDLRDAYSDLLDLDGGALSDDFLRNANNLELMKAAIDGDIDAYNQLMELAGQDILTQVGIDPSRFYTDKANIEAEIYNLTGQKFDDIEVGAALNDQAFLDELTNMVNSAHMTAQQATDYLASMGVDAEVIQQDTTADETSQNIEWENQITATPVARSNRVLSMEGATPAAQTVDTQVWEYNQTVKAKPVTETAKKESKSFALKVTSANKSSGGGFKFSQSKNGGGSSGSNRRSSGSGGGGGGKGGGGGSSKAAEPDKSQKDRKKPIEDTRDIYHDINIQLQQIERQLNRVQDIQDRLYGKQLLDNLNKQTEILEKQKKKLEEKRKIQLQDLADQRKILASLGVTFDAYGNISNYMSRLAAGQKEINKLTDQYNALVDKYNASTDKDYKKTVADEIDEFSKKLKEAEDNYKELEEKIKDYDSLREDMEDLVDDIDEIVQQEVELNITRFNMQLDIRLNMAQAERDWNEFKRNVIYKDNILKDTGFDTIFKDAMHSLDDVYTYFSTAGSKSIIQNLTEQLLDTKTEIEAIDNEGWSEIYGDDKAQAMENLKDNFDELIGQMQDMEELINEIDEAYLDTIDDVKDQFDKQIEDYEFIGELLQHDMDLLELLYGDKNYAAMDRYYAQLNQNNLQQLDSLRKQSQLWYEYWQAAVAEGNVADAAKFEENYREAISNLNSLIEESAENLKDKYINSIEQIFDELDRKISNGKGTDYLSMEWDLMNKNADEYLDTINSAFAVQELQSKYQKAINDTKNIRNQQTLKKLMDAQLENLRAKEKLTQYDVERAEKLLQIEQARMALQDAKASKTTMRLKRNAQGNYSYEYVADNSGVAEAQDALAAAQNDLYNFDKDRYNSNLEDILAAWKDFQSEYKEIIEDASLTEEDRVARLALLREEYGEYINDKTAENLVIRNNLMESAFMDIAALYNVDVENYQQMADDEKEILMGDLVPTWKSGIQEMTNTVVGSGGFLPVCEKAFDNITKATQKYERQLETMSRVAGTNLNMVKNGIDILADSTKTLIDDNDALIDRLTDEIDTIKDLKLEVENLRKQYEDVTKEANKAADAIHNFIKAQEDQAAKEAEKNKKAQAAKQNTSGSSGTGSGSGSGSTGSSSSSGSGSTSSSSASTNRSKYLDYTFKNNWPGRDFYLSGKYVGSFNGSGFTTKDAEIIQDMIDNGIWGKNYSAGAWPIYKSKTKTIDELLKSYGLKTGGYTGDWAGDSGRLALLHQKELVLNQEDTKNVLESINILRSLMGSVNGSITNKLMALADSNKFLTAHSLWNENDLEQNVHIDATFPNVNSKKEIEEAFSELVNLAAQRVLKK